MNTVLFILSLWSYKKEIYAVALTLLFLVSLPVLAVIVITHTGIQMVSDALVGVDAETRTIQIKNPADGSVMSEVTGSIIWPVQGVITLEFGESSLYQPFHTGIDIANANGYIGDPIHPMMNGTVTHIGNLNWGYGKHVIIDHGNNLSTVYGHLCCVYVQEGQEVNIQDVIGGMGSTGWSTGPHLHFEVRVLGVPVEPKVFLI